MRSIRFASSRGASTAALGGTRPAVLRTFAQNSLKGMGFSSAETMVIPRVVGIEPFGEGEAPSEPDGWARREARPPGIVQGDLVPHLVPPLDLERSRADDQHPPSPVPDDQFESHEPRLDRLTEPHVVSDEQADARHRDGTHHRVELIILNIAVADARNTPAANLLERVGMRREGHFVENVWFKGRWGDDQSRTAARASREARSCR